MVPRYKNRRQAGEELAEALAVWSENADVLVLALPRGGVPVAAEVADRLGSDLDVLIVRKLGVPGQEELALGAVAVGGIVVRNDDVMRAVRIDEATFEHLIREETIEVARRNATFRGTRPPPDLAGRIVVLVDDGLATGATMRAAVAAVRSVHPRRIVVGVPVGSSDTCDSLARLADEVVCIHRPANLRAVGMWYEDFVQTTDAEVVELLAGRRIPT